jgi:phospholipid/cholesterol/gamma-HCH transport system permease protein
MGNHSMNDVESQATEGGGSPAFTFNDGSLALSGDWTALRLGRVPDDLARTLSSHEGGICVDVCRIGRIDTAGAFAVGRAIRDGHVADIISRDRDFGDMADLVRPALRTSPERRQRIGAVRALFEKIGRSVEGVVREVYRGQVFAGHLSVALARTARHPRRLRVTPLVAVMEQAGLAAMPIVAVMTFFIGAVLALVGSTMLQSLGVTIYAVELVGIGVMREFGAVVAAILFAGRSASAFAAQIGSMKMNQEVDAMSVMGIDRFDALVVPRVLAALIMLPLLTIVADVGGLTGGLLVSWTLLGIDPALFLQRLVDSVGQQQFWIGMAKTPLLALAIAATGCRQGLAVGGDVQSLGNRVTGAVVQSIFLIIMFDAVFAVLFQRLDL